MNKIDVAEGTLELSRFLCKDIEEIWENHTAEEIKEKYTFDEIKTLIDTEVKKTHDCNRFVV